MNEPHHTNPRTKSNAQGAGTLYVVATPIGNLGDITLRALEVLAYVDHIACEDTRVTRKLLQHYGIKTPCSSYHEHNQMQAGGVLLEKLREGKNIALVSDAGTPLIADPGASLVSEAARCGYRIVPIPGACAAISALSVAAIGTGDAYFAGFLPVKGKERQHALRKLAAMPTTLVLYEAPHRIEATLCDLLDILGNRNAMLARELTKLYETHYRGDLQQLLQQVRQSHPKGEMVLIIAPAEELLTDDALADQMLREALVRLPASKAAAEVAAATGKSKRELYERAISIKNDNA